MMDTYPDVISEFDTVRKMMEGYSIARIGDGELKLMCGRGMRRELPNTSLQEELCNVAQRPHPDCLPAIWTYDPDGPKTQNMLRHRDRFMRVLSPNVQYYSSFISRPDSAPWIECRAYAEMMQSIWAGKKVAVVCERKGSIFYAVRLAAKSIKHIECRTHHAYQTIDDLEKQVLTLRPDVAVLSAGPTATCLANRLAMHGLQALDLGSAGKMLLRNLT